MKRLTATTTKPITVVRQGGHDGPVIGYRVEETFLAVVDGWEFAVEDVPDPLPTEPGTRFYGKAADHPAEWWFVAERRPLEGAPAIPMYVSSGGFIWTDDQAARHALVRLPDPEVGDRG